MIFDPEQPGEWRPEFSWLWVAFAVFLMLVGLVGIVFT